MPVPHLQPGSASLIIASPLSGKKELLYQYVSGCLKNKQPIIFISTDTSSEEIKKELLKNKIFYASQGNIIKFIDCFSHQTGNIIPDKLDIKRVAGPLALNEISIAMAEIEREFLRKNKPAHTVIFDSLSTVLMYSNPEMVGRFIQVLIAKVKNKAGSIIFTIEQGMHDEKTIITMEHLMDGIITLKKEKEKIMIKAQGIKGFEEWAEIK